MSAVRTVRLGRAPLHLLWGLVALGPALLGLAIGLGHPKAAVIAVVPILFLVLKGLAGPGRWIAVLVALGTGLIGKPVSERLPLGGTGVWLADLIVAGVVAGFAIEWMLKPADQRPKLPRMLIMGLPMLLFVGALLIGAARGHQRYDATLIGMPLRLAAYSAIAFALPGVTPVRALKGVTWVLYIGSVYLAMVASYHIATGTSATEVLNLSTGGIRYIGISAATYAAAAFVLAILNLGSGRGRPLLHLTIALLAGFDVIVAYTRTIWLTLTIILLIAVLVAPRIRDALVASVPIVIPVLSLGIVLVLTLAPDLVSTLVERVSTPASQDTSVQWRANAYQAVLSGTSDEPVLGVGFGRETSFSLNGQPNYITGDPHNGFIYVYAGSGILGVAALALVLLAYLADLTRRWRWSSGEARTLVAWCGASWVLLMVHAASEPVFTTPHLMITIWICMVLPSVVVPPPASARARTAELGRLFAWPRRMPVSG